MGCGFHYTRTLAAAMGEATTWSKPSVVGEHHVSKAVWIRDSRGGALPITNVSDAKNRGGGDSYTGGGALTVLYSTCIHVVG